MTVFVKMAMLFAAGYLVGALIRSIRNRQKPVKWYTLVSNDGRSYMDYSNYKDAIRDYKLFSHSGTCYQHTVGGKHGRIMFVW